MENEKVYRGRDSRRNIGKGSRLHGVETTIQSSESKDSSGWERTDGERFLEAIKLNDNSEYIRCQVAGKLSVKTYKEIVERMRQREYEIQGTRTAEEVSNRYVVSYGEGNISKGRGYGVGALTTEHTGEDTRVYDMGENKNSERNSSDDSRRSNAHYSTNRETQSGGDYGGKAVRGTRLSDLVEEYGAKRVPI